MNLFMHSITMSVKRYALYVVCCVVCCCCYCCCCVASLLSRKEYEKIPCYFPVHTGKPGVFSSWIYGKCVFYVCFLNSIIFFIA